jgi:hypothetical protein
MTEPIRVRVRAGLALAYPATESPLPLREELKRLCPQAPRRLNRFTELALLGAVGCVRRADMKLPPECRLYMGTGRGYADDTARLVESVVARGEPPMPVDFINVSGSSTGFYLAQVLGLSGCNTAVAAGALSFEAALDLAWTALAREPGLALVGGVDDVAYPLAVHRARLALAPETPVVEVSSWLLLDSRAEAPGPALGAPRHFSEFSEVLTAVAEGGAVGLSLGGGLSSAERAALAGPRCLPDPGCGQADTAAAFALARWIEEQPGEAFLHVNGDGAGYYLLELGRYRLGDHRATALSGSKGRPDLSTA